MSQLKTDRNYRSARSIPTIVRNILHTVYTSMPGTIEEYNKEKRTATVRGALKFVTEDKPEGMRRPRIFEVPIVWPGSPRWFAHAKLEKGDPVELIFAMRGIDIFLQRDHEESPANPGFFDEKDAIAIPCFGQDNDVEDTDVDDAEYVIQKHDGAVSASFKDEIISFFVDPVKWNLTNQLFKVFAGSTEVVVNRNGSINLEAGSATIIISSSGDIAINSPSAVPITAPSLTHNGVNVGATHIHTTPTGPSGPPM